MKQLLIIILTAVLLLCACNEVRQTEDASVIPSEADIIEHKTEQKSDSTDTGDAKPITEVHISQPDSSQPADISSGEETSTEQKPANNDTGNSGSGGGGCAESGPIFIDIERLEDYVLRSSVDKFRQDDMNVYFENGFSSFGVDKNYLEFFKIPAEYYLPFYDIFPSLSFESCILSDNNWYSYSSYNPGAIPLGFGCIINYSEAYKNKNIVQIYQEKYESPKNLPTKAVKTVAEADIPEKGYKRVLFDIEGSMVLYSFNDGKVSNIIYAKGPYTLSISGFEFYGESFKLGDSIRYNEYTEEMLKDIQLVFDIQNPETAVEFFKQLNAAIDKKHS